MAEWNISQKHEPSEINNGNQYTINDDVSLEQLNAITENAFYAMSKSENANNNSNNALSIANSAKTESSNALNNSQNAQIIANQANENSNQALTNSQQAIETANNASSVANEALDYAVSGNGTAVYVEEKPQTKIYFTDDPQEQINKKISKRPASCIPFFADMWKPKTWNGLTNPDVRCIWSDGDNIYYSKGLEQYVLNVSTSTWKPKTWNGLDEAHLGYFNGYYTWYDGENIYLTAYFDSGFETFSLNKETSTWELKININITFSVYFWTDGVDIYYSNGNSQYVLDKTTFTLKPKTWNGLTNPKATNIWSDGVDIYYSYGSEQYVLNVSTSTWKPKTWNGLTSFYGGNIWSDGVDIYYSSGSEQYVLCKQLKFEKKYL